MRPPLSIIVVTLNAASTLRRALESVQAQEFPSLDLVIVDGASVDATVAIVHELFPDARLVSEPDHGIYDAMNKGLGLARGEWIYFLGADDAFHAPDVLRRLQPHLGDPSLDVLYGDVIMERRGRHRRYGGRFPWFRLYFENVCHQALFCRRRVFDRVGRFDLRYRSLADHAHNFRIFGDRSLRRRHVDLVVADFSAEGASFSIPDEPFIRDRDVLFRNAFGPIRLQVVRTLGRFRNASRDPFFC